MSEGNAWVEEPPVVDESKFSPAAAEGWHCWEGTDGMPAEVEFCEFLASLVRLTRPHLILETGVGQGFSTRRVIEAMPADAVLWAFESDDLWRDKVRDALDDERVTLFDERTPGMDRLGKADLTIVDSDVPYRRLEIREWAATAKPRALLVVHDTQAYPKGELPRTIIDSGIRGVWLQNPRGCFLGEQRGLA